MAAPDLDQAAEPAAVPAPRAHRGVAVPDRHRPAGFPRGNDRRRAAVTAVTAAAPVLLALALCPVAAALAPGDPAEPLARGAALLGWERSLGIASEPAIAAWLRGHATLAGAAELFYVWVHLPATIGALVWVWLEHRRAFAFARDVFVTTQLVAVAGYLAVPTAPPWMLEHASQPAGTSAAHLLQSPYAAMPSGHMAFALIASGCVIALVRHPAVRLAAAGYALLVLAVIVATGNHYWLDAAAGAAAAAFGTAVAAVRR
jgi:PAP2 superfamily